MKPISILIITYNRPNDVLFLLKNIVAQKHAAELVQEVIIINNASVADYDEVVAYVQEGALNFRYINSPENLGVARGRNLAISIAEAPILVTIDDDAYFRDQDALEKVVKIFDEHTAVERPLGALCFKVYYASTLEIQKNLFPHKDFEHYKDKNYFDTSYFTGCGHAIKKEVYGKAGDYPVDFFYGMEEYDLSYRILDHGYSIAFTGEVVVMHNESPLGRTTHAEKMRMFWVNKSKVAYRYLPFIYYITTSFLWSLEFLVKTNWNLVLFFKGWGTIWGIPFKEKRQRVSKNTLAYLKEVGARFTH
ncbi:GT2 family glycosyltransferase [Chitinophaga skermanii]|uniref:GT2 family glycosyltransferase n=1 Tax=Chitinophaga skermanii TaxID=331697 RepID=A0A327QXE6_9BACT|nr:glycosyltransferase [Chitinophaga skermanii]RAJ08394.1 GT2 family glycosyltransferase [Chitinophaga skermanii]